MINLTMNTKELKTYLMKFRSIAKKTSKNTVERTVLFASDENMLHLSIVSSDNLQVEISTNDKIKTSFTINWSKLFNIVKSSNDDIIAFTINENNEIIIESDDIKSNLKQPIIAKLYPVFEKIKYDNNRIVMYKRNLQKITYCLPKKDVRWCLNDLLIDYNENGYTIVASDGGRLAKNTYNFAGFTKQQSIVPKAAINTMLKICDNEQFLDIVINDENDKAIMRQSVTDNKSTNQKVRT